MTDDREFIGELLGRLLAADPQSPVWRDARLMARLASDARIRRDDDAPLTDAMLLAMGQEMLARVTARRFGARWAAESPVVRPRSVREAPSLAVRSAGRDGSAPLVELGTAAGVGREIWDEPVESWIELPPDVPRGQYVALKVVGDSMVPLMHTGDTILVSLGADIKPGRVVVARHPEDGYVCKLLSRLRRRTLELRSLDPTRDPIVIPRDPQLVLGTVIRVWCGHWETPAA